jgi:hypothetical protein
MIAESNGMDKDHDEISGYRLGRSFSSDSPTSLELVACSSSETELSKHDGIVGPTEHWQQHQTSQR